MRGHRSAQLKLTFANLSQVVVLLSLASGCLCSNVILYGRRFAHQFHVHDDGHGVERIMLPTGPGDVTPLIAAAPPASARAGDFSAGRTTAQLLRPSVVLKRPTLAVRSRLWRQPYNQ
jgi:hypothetical protein